MTNSVATSSTYSHPNSWEHAARRLRSLERVMDAGTVRRLGNLSIPGQRCLEAGAGAGSIARWMCSRAGTDGRVLAVDLDTSLLADLRSPNLDVACLDLRTEQLPREAFDLIHVRAVLTHLPERDAVLDALVDALAPRGWLMVEEPDLDATLGRCTGLHRRMTAYLNACLTAAGADLRWGADLPARLAERGLTEVAAEVELPLLRGGTVGVEVYTLTVLQMREQFLAAGATAADLDQWGDALNDATRWMPFLAMTAAWGRKR